MKNKKEKIFQREKKIWTKHDAYAPEFVDEDANKEASQEEIAAYLGKQKKEVKRLKKEDKFYESLGKAPEIDPEFLEANRFLINSYAKNSIEAKISAILHARKEKDEALEKNALKELIELLDGELASLIKEKKYQQAKELAEEINQLKQRRNELVLKSKKEKREKELFDFKKETVRGFLGLVDFIDEIDIDRLKNVKEAQKMGKLSLEIEKQKEILRRKKNEAKFKLMQILTNIENYLDLLEHSKSKRKKEDAQSPGVLFRRMVNTGLVEGSLKSAKKFIQRNFTDITEEEYDDWQFETEKIYGGEVYFERKGLIFPNFMNGRNEVDKIAQELSPDLEKIKKIILEEDKEAEQFFKEMKLLNLF